MKKLLSKNIYIVILLIIGFEISIWTIQGLPTNHSIISQNSEIPISDDLKIDIKQNSSSIGLHSGIEFTITLTNLGSYLMEDLLAEASTTASNVEMTPSSTYSFPSLSETSLAFSISLSVVEPVYNQGVDLVLIVDASGSMGEEIASVKSELTELVHTLTTEIPDIRIGVVVYGWAKYSEYPMSSTENYVPLTTDFEAVKEFIESLYSSGGHEPWGDALYFVDSWDWRENAQKLIILVGDEDCDPGNVIGKDYQGDSWYNGSELVSAVTNLKEKEILISTVVCENPDSNVENQFQWIAKFTGGKSVYLPDLERGEDPVTLPKLIQEWTLELSREYSNWFNIDVIWTDEQGTPFTNSNRTHFWMDFAAPSIIYHEKVIPKELSLFDIQFYVELRDFSPIGYVALYHNAQNNWVVEYPTFDNLTSLYTITVRDLPKGYNLSFHFDFSDNLGNTGRTSDWIIVDIPRYSLGEEVVFIVNASENLASSYQGHSANPHLLCFTGGSWIGDIDINLISLESTQIDPIVDEFIVQTDHLQNHRVLEYSFEDQEYLLNLSMPNNLENYSILEYVWLSPSVISNHSVTNNMTQKIRAHLYQWTLNDSWYICVDYTPSSDLVVLGYVFATDWTYIGNFSVIRALNLSQGTYYILIKATLRKGMYRLIVTDTPSDIDDMYYAESAASGFEMLIIVFSIAFLAIRFRRKFKEI